MNSCYNIMVNNIEFYEKGENLMRERNLYLSKFISSKENSFPKTYLLKDIKTI